MSLNLVPTPGDPGTKIVDCHVAHRPGELYRAEQSLEECNSALFHHFTGTDGNILDTRRRGFELGTSPYVSYVDPDDELIGDPFPTMASVLDTGQYSLVYTNSIVETGDGRRRPHYRQHRWSPEWHWREHLPIHALVLIRRDLLTQVWEEIDANERLRLAMTNRANSMIYTLLIRILPAYYLNEIGYLWNRNGNNSNTLADPEDIYFQYQFKQSLKP